MSSFLDESVADFSHGDFKRKSIAKKVDFVMRIFDRTQTSVCVWLLARGLHGAFSKDSNSHNEPTLRSRRRRCVRYLNLFSVVASRSGGGRRKRPVVYRRLVQRLDEVLLVCYFVK